MTYQILLTREFVQQYKKLDVPIQNRIKEALNQLRVTPEIGKKLTGLLSDRWSHRIGKYRILYKIYKDRFVVLALTVGHRKNIYR